MTSWLLSVPTVRWCDNFVFSGRNDAKLEHYLIPFAACIFVVPLAYGIIAPAVSAGKVSVKPNSIGGKSLFAASMAIAFFFAYTALSIGLVVGLTPLLMDWTRTADDMMIYWLSVPIRLLLAQAVFFVLSLIAGKVFKSAARIDSPKEAWKVAWVPAALVLIADMTLSPVIAPYLEPHH